MAEGNKWLFDKYNKEEYSKEEQIERYKKIIAAHKKFKCNPFRRGKVLINNGVIQKLYNADLPIPDGWVRGAIKK